MDKVKEFLTDDGQVMLILGDSGAGKSTFNRHLEYRLWQDYKPGGHIPLFINLPTIERPSKELIVEQLKSVEFPEELIRELKDRRKLLLICDGYDESQLSTNLHTSNNLNRSGRHGVKMLITCRTQYLGPDYRDRFVPSMSGGYHRPADALFQEAVIAPFSKNQIEKYVEKYVSLEPRIWDIKDYMDKLTAIPNLMDLVKNPFLLTLALEALPVVVEGKSDLSRLCVTRVQLYDVFVHQWLGVNKRRHLEQKLDKEARTILDGVLEEGFEQNGMRFQKDLAAAIFQKQEGRPDVDYVHRRDKASWKAAFFSPEPETTLLRDASLLSRSGTRYRFLHRSVLEYFFSCLVWDSAGQYDADSSASPFSIGTHPLSQRSLVSEPSIIQFLAERVLSHSGFKQNLLVLLERSKSDPQASQAAANAISILVRAGVQFNGADLRGVRIPGADLTGGQFDSALLRGSDLTGVNLTKAWIRQADFNKADMGGVRFGELPYLQERLPIDSCAFSPDGCLIAASYDDDFDFSLYNTHINIYRSQTWTKLNTLLGHNFKITGVAFSPCSRYLISGSWDMTVRLWNCETGTADKILSGHYGKVMAVAFSSCGKQIASADMNGWVRLWDVDTGTTMFTLPGLNSDINSLAYSPNGLILACCGDDGRIQVYDVRAMPSLLALTKGSVRPLCLAFSPDGGRIVAGNILGEVGIYDAAAVEPWSSWKGHIGDVTGVCFSPDSQLLVSCGRDCMVKLWDSQTFTLVYAFTGHLALVTNAIFSPDGSRIASSSRDQTIRLWEVASTAQSLLSYESPDPRTSLAYSYDGRSLVSISRGQLVWQYDSDTGRTIHAFPTNLSQVNCVASSPDGLSIVTGGQSGDLTVWYARTGKAAWIMNGYIGSVLSVAFSTCGRWIISRGGDSTVQLWDANTGRLLHIFSIHDCRRDDISIIFLKNGSEIAYGCLGGQMEVWNTGTWKCEMTVGGISCAFFDFFSPPRQPGLYVKVGSVWDKVFYIDYEQLWDDGFYIEADQLWNEEWNGDEYIWRKSETSRKLSISSCRKWSVAAYGPKLQLSYSTWEEHGARRWICVAAISDFFGDVTRVVWRPDALEFATASEDGSVRVWKVEGDEESRVLVKLVWGSGSTGLAASGAVLIDTAGLSPVNRKLLEQRGAIFNIY